MDFGSLLSAAQQNAKSHNGSEGKKYYSTKFEPPKKETKEKKLSVNIKKFLAQKEEEEKQKELEAKKKYEELMALRTEKDKNKIRKMLKVTKSANRSVLEDAVDKTDTAITLQGPEQPDEDDYGYTSLEASSIYKNLMDKYKTMPEDKKFSNSVDRRSSNGDLLSTKDRVRAAILREKEEEKMGRKRSSTSTSNGATTSTSSQTSQRSDDAHRHRSRKNLYDPRTEREEEERKRREEEEQLRKSKLKKPPPPIMDFKNLLKLAEQKQHEPIQIEVQPKQKEPERLLTNREKRELEMRNTYFAEKERRKNDDSSSGKTQSTAEIHKPTMAPNGRIPKLNASSLSLPAKPASSSRSDVSESRKPLITSVSSKQLPPKEKTSYKTDMPSHHTSSHGKVNSSHISSNLLKTALTKSTESVPNGKKSITTKPLPGQRDNKTRDFPSKDVQKPEILSKVPKEKPIDSKANKSREFPPKDVKTREFPPKDVKTKEFPPKDVKTRAFSPKDVKTREFPPKDVKTREFPPKDVKTRDFPPKNVKTKEFSSKDIKSRELPPKDVKTREFPPKDVKTREFPPKDVKKVIPREFPPKDIKPREFPPSDLKAREFPPRDVQRNGTAVKRKAMPPPKRRIIDDDSEYDSEMDDFIDDDPQDNDYSKYIKEIFGYDKSRFKYEDDDVDNMESNFAQQQREEFLSKKIGLMEDLEDMRLEAEEKKKKSKRRRL